MAEPHEEQKRNQARPARPVREQIKRDWDEWQTVADPGWMIVPVFIKIKEQGAEYCQRSKKGRFPKSFSKEQESRNQGEQRPVITDQIPDRIKNDEECDKKAAI